MTERLFDHDIYSVEAELTEPSFDADAFADWESPITQWPDGELPIVVNQDRVDEVLGTLVDDFLNKRYPYNTKGARVPHEPSNMPPSLERDGSEHAMFHFIGCYYMRGGIKSHDAYRRLSLMYEARPDLFDCSEVVARVAADGAPNEGQAVEVDDDREAVLQQEVFDALSQAGLGFQNTISELWVENAIRLYERYGGDPRKIFLGVDNYDEALLRIMNDGKGGGFIGFREKMTSMLAYFLVDDGLIEEFNFPIPVDFHVMRISIANELITFPGVPDNINLYRPETTAALRKLYLDYAERKGVSPLRLCDAVWLMSQLMCSRAPGNTTIEPGDRTRRKGRSTVLLPLEINEADRDQQRDYAQSCGRCALQDSCVASIGAAQYYINGALAIRGPRHVFPKLQGELFDGDLRRS